MRSVMTSRVDSASVKGLVIAFTYGICSASMAFVNKAVLSSYEYDFPIFLVACQMLFTILVLECARELKVISIHEFTFEKGKSFLLPSVFYALNSVLALWALSGMNIPMYGVIKRCSPLLILIMGPFLLGKPTPDCRTSLSIALITTGCIVAGTCNFYVSCRIQSAGFFFRFFPGGEG